MSPKLNDKSSKNYDEKAGIDIKLKANCFSRLIILYHSSAYEEINDYPYYVCAMYHTYVRRMFSVTGREATSLCRIDIIIAASSFLECLDREPHSV